MWLLVCRINTGSILSPAPNTFNDTLPAGMTLMGNVTSTAPSGVLDVCGVCSVRVCMVWWPDLLLDTSLVVAGGSLWLAVVHVQMRVHGCLQCATQTGALDNVELP